MPGRDSRVFVSLGGNLGDPAQSMGAALRALDAHPQVRVTAVSSLHRTPPWGKTDQPDFLNSAAELHTMLRPRELLELCLQTEHSLKRVREERWGPRLIDIDILLYDDRVINETGLEVPHPRMLQRAFVLAPLSELAPTLEIDGQRVGELLAGVDAAGIERLDSGREWWRG